MKTTLFLPCLAALTLTACVTSQPHTDMEPVTPLQVQPVIQPDLELMPKRRMLRQDKTMPVEVIRSGRYTLVELLPTAGQSDLINQVVQVRIPKLHQQPAMVGEAMRYVLLHTGFSLCEGTDATFKLDKLPLPAVHTQLGPLQLKDALITLAGPAWALMLDEVGREICFMAVLPAQAIQTADGKEVQ